VRLIHLDRQSVIAWQAISASDGVLMATAIQGLVINSRPSYESQRWHATLMAMAIVIVCLIFNSFLSKVLPHVETATLAPHVLLFIIVLVIITVMSPEKSSNSEVWTLFLNDAGYESKGLSFFVGLITPVFAFTGVDGAVHMSEEVRNSNRVVPWAMMGTCEHVRILLGSDNSNQALSPSMELLGSPC
jgi:choline transport protein